MQSPDVEFLEFGIAAQFHSVCFVEQSRTWSTKVSETDFQWRRLNDNRRISCDVTRCPLTFPGLLFLFLPSRWRGEIAELIKRPLSMLEAGPLINSSASFVFAKSSLAPRPIHAAYETICGVVLAVTLTRDSRPAGVCCTGRIYIPGGSSLHRVKFRFCSVPCHRAFYTPLARV